MELFLHLGAHRTGSTAFQRTLKRNGDVLAAAGTAYWGPEWMRGRDHLMLRDNGRFDTGAEAAVAEDLAATGAARLIVSDENILGSMRRNLLEGGFYAGAVARLVAYCSHLGMEPARIGLGIRDYAAYWVSAYSYLLPAKPLPDFAALKPALLAPDRGWREVIADLRGLFPRAEIMVWPLEAVQGRMRALVARFADQTPQRLRGVEKRINTAPGLAAIPAVRAIRAAEPDLNGAQMRARLAEMDLAGAPAPELFTGAERRALAARYAEDCAALAAGFADVRYLAEGRI
ncbi:hypothetical protein [Sinisalibacter aestuarii]|uniref:Sulfotransferase family protein n=1 Tax=Sinisalibacter aestuarii TaxID=2949426 RepID=A0ABQ5LW59_9RHOB|nr:hypothetical protein [Sinisalibacter aestuarii]GKY88342.1 hypothetical protein STA1M1_22110 [Sinisalibacter aestuarii]